eukprot:1772595-Rhodomonas_salina.1
MMSAEREREVHPPSCEQSACQRRMARKAAGAETKVEVDAGQVCSTPQNQIQETAIPAQFAPGMRFLVFEFAV